MQDNNSSAKPVSIDMLPTEVAFFIAENYLSTQDISSLTLVTQSHLTLFKPLLCIHKFIHFVMHGQIDEAQKMLKKDISLLFKKIKATDCTGRIFLKISGFQYALWALDMHMWDMMIKVEKNLEAWNILLAQYTEVAQAKVRYLLDTNEVISEQHYDFLIVDALEKHANYFERPLEEITNWDEMQKQWQIEVGSAQFKAPVHIALAYSSNEPFTKDYDVTQPPEFTDEHWFSKAYNNNKLGKNFGMIKLANFKAVPYSGPTPTDWKEPGLDLLLMKKLRDTRKAKFISLENDINEKIRQLQTTETLN